MINKIKLDGVPLDAISDLESPDYESIIKQQLNILMLLLSPQIVSPSLTKFIESSGKPFYLSCPKMNSAYTNFIKKRFYQIKILLANMYNNSFFKKILVVACVVFLYS
jgi:starch synthase